MTKRSVALIVLSILVLVACKKNDDNNQLNNPDNNHSSNPNLYQPGNTLLIDDVVLYTSGEAHRDPQLIKAFLNRNFPEYVGTFYPGQSSVSNSKATPQMEFLDNNKVKLNGKITEIISKTDTLMTLAEVDSTNMPDDVAPLIGRCAVLNETLPQITAKSICAAAGGSCTKYRKQYPILIKGNDYYLPQLHTAVSSKTCMIISISTPSLNFLNTNTVNQLIAQDSVIVQISRIKMTKGSN
jgi:hypothetical protein